MPRPQLTKTEAIHFYEKGYWKEMSALAIVDFQLYQERTCMPFGAFHDALENVLGRPFWSCEFIMPLVLQEEFERKRRKLAIASTITMFAILLMPLLGEIRM